MNNPIAVYNHAYLASLKKALQEVENSSDVNATWLCQVLGSLVDACLSMPPLDIQRINALWLIEHGDCIYEAYVQARLDAHHPNWRYHDPSPSLTARSERIARLAAHTLDANLDDDTLSQFHSWMAPPLAQQSKMIAAALPMLTQLDQTIHAQMEVCHE